MFAVAFLQDLGSGRLRLEEKLLKAELERREIPVELYTLKRIQRRSLPLSAESFVSGDMDAMHGAMAQLEIAVPPPNDYPASLAPYLHRRIWKSTLGEVERRVFEYSGQPVFVKPAERRKSFTGRVVGPSSGDAPIGAVSRRQEVWCSEVVDWISEYRVYVIDDEIVGVDHYAGDPGVSLDMGKVAEALSAYRKSGEAPSAYGIDFGVLHNGESALVEANDGYALGAYEIAAKPYTDLLIRRWQELLQGRKPCAS
jgi:hypothetical protein